MSRTATKFTGRTIYLPDDQFERIIVQALQPEVVASSLGP
jgi:hypothetical protein